MKKARTEPTRPTNPRTLALTALIGQRVTFFCIRYIYTGKLVAMDADNALLEDAAIVYETGPLTTAEWLDAQKLPRPWYVARQSIESFGLLK